MKFSFYLKDLTFEIINIKNKDIMETSDRLRTEDQVNVKVLGPDDSNLYESTNSGFHSIEEAIKNALENANLQVDPEDCVFVVSNQDTGVTHKYRINAHGNLKLIV